jgi:aspartate racemase
MSPKKLKTVGILGGMGPEATAHFLGLIVKNTRAAKDQDHIPVVMSSVPQIPDRTEAILRGGPSPLPLLVRGIKVLARAGADFAAIPCISAHYFHRALAARSPIPVVNLLEETVKEIRKKYPRMEKVGLIATSGTVRSGIVHGVFGPAGLEVLTPDPREQRRVMTAIYGPRGIKAGVTVGPPRKVILEIVENLVGRGAQGILAGCTEVPLVLGELDLSVPLIDPMAIGALTCIKKAGGRARKGRRPDR